MLIEGLQLMVMGMVVVFIFLTMLVVTIELSHRFFDHFAKYFPEAPPPGAVHKKATGENELQEVAVMLAAIKARLQ